MWNEHDNLEFLRCIGACARDEVGNEGITEAGLLMFGKYVDILAQFPHYMVDFREYEDTDGPDWIDRVVPDGSRAGNIFEFFNLVLPKLLFSNREAPWPLRIPQPRCYASANQNCDGRRDK